jgi:aspartate racemase
LLKKEKTVGVLGGMGPFATVEFFKKVLQYTPAKKDWDHLHLIIDNNVKIPSRTRSVLYDEENPSSYIIKSINNLAKIGAEIVVLPCNSAHYFYDQVVDDITIPWLSIIKTTADVAISNNLKKTLVLGGYLTTEKKLYNKYLSSAVYLPDSDNRFIESVIEEVKLSSTISKDTRNKFEELINNNANSFDCIVLACTEFSVILPIIQTFGFQLIDSTTEYVKKIISIAMNKG